MYTSQMSNSYYSPTSNAYHMTNYRGNQAGHDLYLRADSMNPSQFQTSPSLGYSVSTQPYGSNQPYGLNQPYTASSGFNQAYRTPMNFGQSQSYRTTFGLQPIPHPISSIGTGRSIQMNQSFMNAIPQSAYHTSQYRGNQAGHDQYLREDSSTPAQQQLSPYAFQPSMSMYR
jgi:hypothetical protein